MTAPVLFRWSGTAMEPLTRFAPRCDEQYTVGEVYRLDAVEERSQASHSHFFAAVTDRWLSLPDALAIQFPTADALRKHALIMQGFRRERKFVASSEKEARKLATFLRPQTADDDYAIISLHGNVVVEWKAISQSYKAMPRKGEFQRSKEAVLEYLDDMLGIKTEAA